MREAFGAKLKNGLMAVFLFVVTFFNKIRYNVYK